MFRPMFRPTFRSSATAARARLHPLFILILSLVACLAPVFGASAQDPVGFTKSFGPSTIGPGSVSTLQFDITNFTSIGARNLAFTDTLPAGVTIASPANVVNSCGGTVSAPDGGSTISLSGGQVGASASCSVSVDVTSSTPGTHTNVSGDLTSDLGNSGPATADLTVATDRPGFSKSFSPDPVFFGERSTLVFTIDNTANSSQALSLSFTDNLPVGMEVADPANASTTCGGGVVTAPEGGGVISYGPAFFGDATVGAGSSCTVSVDVLGGAVGELDNVSDELTSTPPTGTPTRSSGKASATLTVNVEQISLIKSFVDDPVPPGGTVTLEFTIRNLDRRSSATNIAFTDDIDAVISGLTPVGLPLTDPCGSGSTLSESGGVLSLTGGSLAAGASCTFSVTLQVPSTASSGSFTNTTSSITADVGGEPVTGNPASDILFVEPAPLLTKEFTDDPVGAGGTVTLEFTLTNTSPDFSATDIAFIDELDAILLNGVVPADGFCGAGSTATFTPATSFQPARITVSGASLVAAGSCTFSISLDIANTAPAGTLTNTTGEVTATVNGEVVTGDPASDDLQVIGAPVLTKEFTDDPVIAGGTATLEFTLAHDEFAPGDATGISFTDDLDATLSGLVATGLPLSDVCGIGSEISGTMTLTFSGGALIPGGTCTFSVTLQVPTDAPAGPHTNTTSSVVATVDSSAGPVSTTGNAATDDLRVAGLTLTKEFIDDPVLPGGTVTLRFTIDNINPVSTASAIFFQDDLDAALDGLTATGLPLADICGTGSSLSGLSGDMLLVFDNGALAAGESCSFDVSLQVPSTALPDTYGNITSAFSADIGGTTVFFDNAADQLVVDDNLLALDKEFTDDPVAPGDNATLEFTLTNLSDVDSIADIAFTDDLDAALSGLVSVSGTLADICGLGSQITGTDVLGFTGGSLGPGATCTFSVTVSVPGTAERGTLATNTTSEVTGTSGGLPVRGDPAVADLQIDALTFTKSFGGVGNPGGTVTLLFKIESASGSPGFSDLTFSDDLDAVIPGLTAVGLPASDVCGTGSLLTGASLLTFTDGSLLPGGSCSFSVTLQIPSTAVAGSFVNTTTDLTVFGISVAAPAIANLVIEAVVDSDGDDVLDGDDLCPGTVIPEATVPSRSLGTNRYALVDADTTFDTKAPRGRGPQETFTTTDTGGCSCEQIIDALDLGAGHTRFGCSLGVMRDWVEMAGTASSVEAIEARPYEEAPSEAEARRLGVE